MHGTGDMTRQAAGGDDAALTTHPYGPYALTGPQPRAEPGRTPLRAWFPDLVF